LAIAALTLWVAWRYRLRPAPPPGQERREALAGEAAADMVRVKGLIDEGWVGVLQRGKAWAEDAQLVANYEALRDRGRELVERQSEIAVAYGPKSNAATAVRASYRAIAAQAGWSLRTVDKMLATYGHGEVGALDEVDAAFASHKPNLRVVGGSE
jgi:hypothetical protein